MKQLILTTFSVLFVTLLSFSQKTMNVELKITYRNNPLCNWEVTIKHGDVQIAKGKTDDQGIVKFNNASLLSLSIDAYGYKATSNGDKKWDVKGYITLGENGKANFDFEKLLEDTGMPASMMEAAWGLTLNDCGQLSSGSSSSGTSSTNSGSNASDSENSTPDKVESPVKNDEQSDWDKEQAEAEAERKAEAEQRKEDFESGKTAAEGMQNQKAQLEGKIEGLNGKIARRQTEVDKTTFRTKEYSDLSYELRDLVLERQLAEIKLEKTNKMIANGNAPLSKDLRQDFNEREDAVKAEQKQLAADKKAGIYFGNVTPLEKTEATKTTEQSSPKKEVETENKSSKTEETKKEEPKTEETKKEVTKAEEVKKEETKEEETEEPFTVYTDAEIANMSTVGLQKAKMGYNSKIANRKVALKTKGGMMKQDKKAKMEAEIEQLNKLIEQMNVELAKRKEAE